MLMVPSGGGKGIVRFYGESHGVRPSTAQTTDTGHSSKANNRLVSTFQGALSWQARLRNYTIRMKSKWASKVIGGSIPVLTPREEGFRHVLNFPGDIFTSQKGNDKTI
jgi:hypothetical protein